MFVCVNDRYLNNSLCARGNNAYRFGSCEVRPPGIKRAFSSELKKEVGFANVCINLKSMHMEYMKNNFCNADGFVNDGMRVRVCAVYDVVVYIRSSIVDG